METAKDPSVCEIAMFAAAENYSVMRYDMDELLALLPR